MADRSALTNQFRVHQRFAVQFLSILVSLNGIYILALSLLEQLAVRRGTRVNGTDVDVSVLIGLSLFYLGTILRRRKRTAWMVAIGVYTFYLVSGLTQLLTRHYVGIFRLQEIIRVVLFPLVVLALLMIFQRDFVVKSDIQGFRFATGFAVLILFVALIYGVTGFLLLDESDFHQEISFGSAVHYTVDQFNLTTTKPLQPYTKRAHLFVDSLSIVSLGAVIYAALSLFQPLRVRLTDQTAAREHMRNLLEQYGAPSEEYFKLWPQDKQYFFDHTGQSGLAFHVYRGVALCLSDPVGDPKQFPKLMSDFQNLCFNNDWLPALVHVAEDNRQLYENHGFVLQKLGQEAVVNIEKFQEQLSGAKYFRQITNKFKKQGYTTELLQPPHHKAVLQRLKTISDEWLGQGGRAERGFAMGYFSATYMQQCDILVARDAAGTIQSFVNIVPAGFDKQEATYDLLRNSQQSLGNSNDYLLMQLIAALQKQGYKRLNLGLCPLGGLDEPDNEQPTLIDNFLQFAYANGDRFYSFSGLHRFKAKYEPEWQDRYIGYQSGMRGFSRTITALTRCMRVVVKQPRASDTL